MRHRNPGALDIGTPRSGTTVDAHLMPLPLQAHKLAQQEEPYRAIDGADVSDLQGGTSFAQAMPRYDPLQP
jgi:hypothetical protein